MKGQQKVREPQVVFENLVLAPEYTVSRHGCILLSRFRIHGEINNR